MFLGKSKIMKTCLLEEVTCFRAGWLQPSKIILNKLVIFLKHVSSRPRGSLSINGGQFEIVIFTEGVNSGETCTNVIYYDSILYQVIYKSLFF